MSATKTQEQEVHDVSDMIEVANVTVLESMTRGEIFAQVQTAKSFPRSLTVFRKEATEMVSLDEETAEACIYSVPRAGKAITGPSVRFAEIILSAWGNCRAGYRPVNEEERYVTAQGVFADLQRNTAITAEVRRGIVEKTGRRFKDDMINVTMNAAGSVAFRNAVTRGIPKAIWLPIYNAAKKVAIGDASTLSARRQKVVDYFGKMGVTIDRVLEVIEKEGIDDVTLDDLETLTGLKTAIKDGLPVDKAFPIGGAKGPAAAAKPAQTAEDALTARLEEEQRERDAAKGEPTKPATEADSKPTREPGEEDVTEEDRQRVNLEELFDAIAEKESKAFASDTLENSKRDDGKLIGKRLPGKVRAEDLGAAIKALQEKCRQLGI